MIHFYHVTKRFDRALIGHAVARGVLARHHVAVVPVKNGLLLVYRRAGE